MRHPVWHKIGLIVISALSLCMALTATAGADQAQYPSDAAARTFTGGTGGWTASTESEGLCVAPFVCARVENKYVASGDAEGNGYISSDYLGVAGVDTVGGTTSGIWQSPAFTYNGGQLALTLSRRADVGQLLAVAGSSADYAIRLVDLSEGNQVQTIVAPSTLAGADQWTPIPAASVGPGKLTTGHRYQLRIVTRYTTGTSVLVTGSADYDNVVLGPDPSAPGGGGGGSGGGKGKGNGTGSGGGDGSGLGSSELLSLFSSGQSNSAAVTGNGMRLMVWVACPKRIGRACRITAQGLLRKGRPATGRHKVKVPKGKKRRVVLRVKPKLRSTVAKRKRLLVKERVRAGSATATAYKVRKVIRR